MPASISCWITSDAAKPFFEKAKSGLESGGSRTSIQKKLRDEIGSEKAIQIFEQLSLREKAAKKFTNPGEMFFTDVGLQQASSTPVARYKSGRFESGQDCHDLCCGIGGDLIELAAVTNCRGVEIDERIAHFAEMNLMACGRTGSISRDDVESINLPPDSLVHIDPARRSQSRRTTRLEFFQPPLPYLETLIRQTRGLAIKLAPASIVPQSWRHECEIEWIGHGRECKQQVCWFGSLARNPGRHVATLLNHTDAHSLVETKDAKDVEKVSAMRSFVVVPNPEVTIAHVATSLACQIDYAMAATTPPLLTGNHAAKTPFGRCYEILEQLSPAPSKLVAAIHRLNPSRVVFKCRKPFDDLPRIENKLNLQRDGCGGQITLITVELGNKPKALLCREIRTKGQNAKRDS